jgi:hypothetical protein
MTFWAVFKSVGSGSGAKESAKSAPFDSLEFFFTRALSRKSLFYAKASVFLLICFTPVALPLIASYTNPKMRVDFYQGSKGEKATKQFYMANFSGAHIEKDLKDKGGDHYYVALPKGRTDKAFLGFVVGCTGALLYQLGSFLLWDKRWAQWLMVLAWFGLPYYFLRFIYVPKSAGIPSGYETNLVLVNQHSALVLLGLGLLFIVTQAYACQRFVKTEILA